MVAPLAVVGGMAAAGLASGLVQYYNAERARGANARELRRIEELLGKVESPTFRPEDLTPEDYAVVETYTPQLAGFVQELRPELIQETEAMRAGRSAEMVAMQRLSQRGRGMEDPILQTMLAQAGRRGQIDAQSRQQSILQDAARRGQLGSGSLLAAQLQAAESSQDRAAELGQSAAIEAERNALQSILQSGQLGRSIRQDDIAFQGRQNDVINQFNQRMANQQNMYNQYAANLANEAQRANIAARQDVANRNVAGQNQAKANRINLEQQRYQNDLDRFRARQGISSERMGQNVARAADQNQMIQGITNVGMSAAGMYQDAQQRQADRDSQQRIAELKYGNQEYDPMAQQRAKYGSYGV